jgi:hypothetical protein
MLLRWNFLAVTPAFFPAFTQTAASMVVKAGRFIDRYR